jgi:hypothetical protein
MDALRRMAMKETRHVPQVGFFDQADDGCRPVWHGLVKQLPFGHHVSSYLIMLFYGWPQARHRVVGNGGP